MKKMMLYGSLLLGVWFFLQNFTMVNLSIKLLFIDSNNYVELQDRMENEELIFERIGGKEFKNNQAPEHLSGFNSIEYFPERNFYLIRDYRNPKLYKINSLGNVSYELGVKELPSQHFSFIGHGLAFSKNDAYNLTDEEPIAQQFEEVLNKELSFSTEEWNRIFKKLYKESSIVIYNYLGDSDSQTGIIYFHHQNEWKKLHSLKRSTIFKQGNTVFTIGIGEEDFYAKYPVAYQSYYLKDSTAKAFSNNTRTTDQQFRMGDHLFSDEAIAESELEYPRGGKIKTKAFKKKDYLDHYLLPKIPVETYGEAYYQLSIEERTLKFKTNASKTMFAKVQTDLYLFGPPKEFEHRNKVRFLAYNYPTNFLDNGKTGVYVIRIK